jgi:predicted RNA binding protein YcfA (HicA-like mRNA interferase family)
MQGFSWRKKVGGVGQRTGGHSRIKAATGRVQTVLAHSKHDVSDLSEIGTGKATS